jgi:uncharacterized protein YbjT (DUF2867 family)
VQTPITERSIEMKIAVAGATGRVGHHVVDVLDERGHEVVAISRANGVDVITGDGLDDALSGVEVIIDAATGPSPEQQAATEFFTTAARNLQAAGSRAGVRRIVVVSIIGTDGSTGGYNAAKVEHEKAMLAGPIPAQVLRAAQFHEFVEQLVDWGTQGDVAYVPVMRTQLVAARTVAETLVELAVVPVPETTAAPIPEVAGPREERLIDVARLFVAQRGEPLRIDEVSDPDNPDRDRFENGGLLPAPHATLAGPSYADWLHHPDAVSPTQKIHNAAGSR